MLKIDQAPAKPSEELIQSALAAYFDWSANRCFPSVMMWAWEQDFVVISKAMVVWEIEIKVNYQDWLADEHKSKWHHPSWPKVGRFWYCVTPDMLEKGIPEFVDHRVGVLVAKKHQGKTGPKWFIHEHRKAQKLSTFRLSPKWLAKLLHSTYFRYWRTRKHDPTSTIFADMRHDSDDLEAGSMLVQSIAGAADVPDPAPT